MSHNLLNNEEFKAQAEGLPEKILDNHREFSEFIGGGSGMLKLIAQWNVTKIKAKEGMKQIQYHINELKKEWLKSR